MFKLFLSSNLSKIFLVLVIAIAAFIIIFVPVFLIFRRYKQFVLMHSSAIKHLNEINKNYSFKNVPNFDLKHSYDNENFYDDISCYDYLVYELVFLKNKVNIALKDTLENSKLYSEYSNEIKNKCKMNQFDTINLPRFRNLLQIIEKKLFKNYTKTPTIIFSIKVCLINTNINGFYKRSKSYTFSSKEVKNVITMICQKRGNYYLNRDIWNSICRVERGKVTNKMRFAIYKRDHNRCRKCGSRSNLEIDHIIPISKGGKSVYDNLQTLCSKCNYEKGSKIDY